MTTWVGTAADLALGGFTPSSGAQDGIGTDSGHSDAQLMQRYRNGDAEAFRRLYARHRERLYRHVLRLARNPAEADEIFQDIWLAVVRHSATYRPTAKFVTYLFAIAHRRITDRMRRQTRADEVRAEIEEVEQLANETSQQPQEIALFLENHEALNAAIERLPIVQREAFLMQAMGEMSLEEIAEATSTGRETVKSRLRYAYARLRRELEVNR